MLIRRIGVLSAVKIGAALYGAIGLIIGLVVSVVALAGASLAGMDEAIGGGAAQTLLGAGAVIVFPVIYGLLGAVGLGISALIYNAVAKVTGGLELQIDTTPRA
jgi:hypothetical protein